MTQRWRPIKTAPRDGRRIIAYRPMAPETSDELVEVVITTRHATKSPQGVLHYTDRWCHPTHWLPIPELPKVRQ